MARSARRIRTNEQTTRWPDRDIRTSFPTCRRRQESNPLGIGVDPTQLRTPLKKHCRNCDSPFLSSPSKWTTYCERCVATLAIIWQELEEPRILGTTSTIWEPFSLLRTYMATGSRSSTKTDDMSPYVLSDPEPISLWIPSQDSAFLDSSNPDYRYHVSLLAHPLAPRPPYPNEWSRTTTNLTILCPHLEEDLPPNKPKGPTTHDLPDLREEQEMTP
jgi:hypothetical protein